jgi:hypothetical protein
MPSAKHSNLQKGKAIRTLLTNSDNKIGDKCLPWDTPDVHEKMFDLMLNNFTTVACSLKKKSGSRGQQSPLLPVIGEFCNKTNDNGRNSCQLEVISSTGL